MPMNNSKEISGVKKELSSEKFIKKTHKKYIRISEGIQKRIFEGVPGGTSEN